MKHQLKYTLAQKVLLFQAKLFLFYIKCFIESVLWYCFLIHLRLSQMINKSYLSLSSPGRFLAKDNCLAISFEKIEVLLNSPISHFYSNFLSFWKFKVKTNCILMSKTKTTVSYKATSKRSEHDQIKFKKSVLAAVGFEPTPPRRGRGCSVE